MRRWSRLVLVLVWLAVAGCGQGHTDQETQVSQAKSTNPVRPSRTTDPGKSSSQPALSSVKVIFLMDPVYQPSRKKMVRVSIQGDPDDPNMRNGYQIKNIHSVEGAKPPQGTYFLRKHLSTFTTTGKPLEEKSVDTESGPFFDRKLAAGTELVGVVWLGHCKADVEGWTSTESRAVQKGVTFQVYEGTVLKK
jgi:hypothetical protein